MLELLGLSHGEDSDPELESARHDTEAKARAFLRLCNINGSAFDLLNRYEVSLWRQAVQLITPAGLRHGRETKPIGANSTLRPLRDSMLRRGVVATIRARWDSGNDNQDPKWGAPGYLGSRSLPVPAVIAMPPGGAMTTGRAFLCSPLMRRPRNTFQPFRR